MATNNRAERAAERAKAAENRVKRSQGNNNAATPATAPAAKRARRTAATSSLQLTSAAGTSSLQTANVAGTSLQPTSAAGTSLQTTVVHHHHYAAAVNAAVNPLEIVKLMKELEKLLQEASNKRNNKCISRQALQKIVQDLKTASHRGQLEVTINNEPKKNSIRNKIGYCVKSTLGQVCLGIAGTAFGLIMKHQLTGEQSLHFGLIYAVSNILVNLRNAWAKGQLNRKQAADLTAALSAVRARWGGNSSSSSSPYIHALCGSNAIMKAIINETTNNTSTTSPFFT